MLSKIIQAWGRDAWLRLSPDEKLRIKHQWEQRRLMRERKARQKITPWQTEILVRVLCSNGVIKTNI